MLCLFCTTCRPRIDCKLSKCLAAKTPSVSLPRPDGSYVALINSEGLNNVFTTISLSEIQKCKRLTLRNEQSLLRKRGSILNLKRLYTLEERCKINNISYLYDDLMKAKTTDQFKFTMSLINKMLDGNTKSGL